MSTVDTNVAESAVVRTSSAVPHRPFSQQEYILQERCLPSDMLDSHVGVLEAPPTTSKVVHRRGKKLKRSMRSGGGRLDATSSSRDSPTTTNSAFGESSSMGGHEGVEDDSIDGLKERIRRGSDGKGRWSRWRTVCKSRRPSEKIEMPRDDQAPHRPLLPVVSLQYRVVARHRVASGRRTMFRYGNVSSVMMPTVGSGGNGGSTCFLSGSTSFRFLPLYVGVAMQYIPE